jgi:tetratricopeptide (TPR) repeat protein
MVVASGVWASPAPRDSEDYPLGRIDFPVTGPPSARRHFLRGMLALHSFWYEEAADEFRAATAAAPDFVMGYWGEALTYYHPVWAQEDLAASRMVMARLPTAPHVDVHERAFIDAARALFGEGSRSLRWRRYAEAMGEIYRARPTDDEAATLYAVALLGEALGERQLDGQATTFRPFAEAGAIALAVMARNPMHPGAAHYLIHAFDDPEHAILALPAARRYASIAPEAYHARHMPSHIFVQLGMWPEAAASNESAWKASEVWVHRKHLDTSHLDFHSLSWLLSIRLEMGQRGRAEETLALARAALVRSRDPGRLPLIYSEMVGQYLLQTADWTQLDERLRPLEALVDGTPIYPHRAAPASQSTTASVAAIPTCHPATERASRMAQEARALLVFLRGEAALAHRDVATLAEQVEALSRLQPTMEGATRDLWKMRELELRAGAAEVSGKIDDAITELRQAIALDEHTPPSGPAGEATPRELMGELLQRQGKPSAALSEFVKTLEIHPGRTRALLGAARAATATGDYRAPGWWSRLAALWAEADSNTAGLEEARRVRPTGRVPK